MVEKNADNMIIKVKCKEIIKSQNKTQAVNIE